MDPSPESIEIKWRRKLPDEETLGSQSKTCNDERVSGEPM
jgi:hypothetical protein